MFDIGFGELLLTAVVALLVLGPEKLPRAARFAGLWVRKARNQWNAVKAELENELADEELRRNLREASDAMRNSAAQARGSFDGLGHAIDPRAQMLPLAATPALDPEPPEESELPDPANPGPPKPVPAPLHRGHYPSALADDPPRAAPDPAQLSLLEPASPSSPPADPHRDADERA